ncbi:hypothetical protein NEFER03_1169 [Nematocida sp. LUAm3]|nr:hypothetical protein NEFER03_1169 [Nematocida sp. LUAm3]KAI5175778.1 hypothetical protein NEFER02_1647 [Nematocida sp. LUAm2]KAI5178274.1 hypothetical protein NEFER01_1441 [Nematocida sp. LUAm1]
MEKESFTLKRSKEAYIRIKMILPTDLPMVEEIPAPHRISVERLQSVIHALSSLEEGKTLLSKNETHERSAEFLKQMERTEKGLKKYISSEVFKKVADRLHKRIEKVEKNLDKEVENKLMRRIKEETNDPWNEQLVHRKRKMILFVNTIRRYIEEELIKKVLSKKMEENSFISRVKLLAEEAYKFHEVTAILDVINGILDKEVKKEISESCYKVIKSMKDSNSRVISVIQLGKYYCMNYPNVTQTKEVDQDLFEIIRENCKNLFLEAETFYSSAPVDDKHLVDESLNDFLKAIREIDAFPKIFEKWTKKRQPILRAIWMASQEKANRLGGVRGSILLSNSIQALKSFGQKDLPDKETVEKIKKEVEKSLTRAVEASPSKNKIAAILRFVEEFSQESKEYKIKSKYKKEIRESFLQSTKNLAQKHGSLDDISSGHLQEVISNIFQ